eukprot:scaffold587_cov339-Pavlova_lutheri.AAC.29
MTEVVLRVAMTCQGCAGSVRRVLGKVDGAPTFPREEKEDGEERKKRRETSADRPRPTVP